MPFEIHNGLAAVLTHLDHSTYLRFAQRLLSDFYGYPDTEFALTQSPLWHFNTGGGSVAFGSNWHESWFYQFAYLSPALQQEAVVPDFLHRSVRGLLLDLGRLNNVALLYKLRLRRSHGEALSWLRSHSSHDVNMDFCFDENNVFHFFTNIDDRFLLDKDAHVTEQATEAFYGEAQAVFGTDIYAEFVVGTPKTIVKGNPDAAARSLTEIINTPRNLYLVAREGRIVVAPRIEHGIYFASPGKERFIGDAACGLAAAISSSAKRHLGLSRNILDDFEVLLNCKRTKEADVQAFLEEYPQILLSLDENYCDVRPHVCLVDRAETTLIPDFMVKVEDSRVWDLIELKLPQQPITIRTQGAEAFSAAAAKAICQVLQYREAILAPGVRRRLSAEYGIQTCDPALVVLLGRGDPGAAYEWRDVKFKFPKVEVLPYDYLLLKARQAMAAMESLHEFQND